MMLKYKYKYADLAQLVEHLIRNEQVEGSSPLIGTSIKIKLKVLHRFYKKGKYNGNITHRRK